MQAPHSITVSDRESLSPLALATKTSWAPPVIPAQTPLCIHRFFREIYILYLWLYLWTTDRGGGQFIIENGIISDTVRHHAIRISCIRCGVII